MLRVCRSCEPNQYTLKLVCPQCGGPTVLPYGSTSTYQPGSGRSLKQLVQRRPPPSGMIGGSVDEVVEAIESPSVTSYGLIHTLGRTRFDEFGGDGAYSNWMQDYFSGPGQYSSGCLCVAPILHQGSVGSISNEDLPKEFNPGFLKKFQALILDERYRLVNVVILNWHVRFTNGTPNGWTGRGINTKLVKAMRQLCTAANKKLAIVYTVHEISNLDGRLFSPTGLIALNPDVGRSLESQFPDTTRYLSKVPGLMRSLHTVQIDLILKIAGKYLSSIDVESPSSNLYLAHAQQYLRLRHGHALGSLGLQGIVIFGMIMPRHGLSVESITMLCNCMDKAGLSPDLKVVIAGKESSAPLVRDLKRLALKIPRVRFLGQIADFGELAGCRYAISFDELGYRDNASAMVNVIRAGHLLFSRRRQESDESLVVGAVKAMALCEKSLYFYYELLAQQQPRMRSTAPDLVGANLDRFFKQIATTVHYSQ